jgi:hypothetical protein
LRRTAPPIGPPVHAAPIAMSTDERGSDLATDARIG